jgi:hypothetical protein
MFAYVTLYYTTHPHNCTHLPSSITDVWQTSHTAGNRGVPISLDDRKALGKGLCHVAAAIEGVGNSISCIDSIMFPSFKKLDQFTCSDIVDDRSASQSTTQSRVSDELRMITVLLREYTIATSDVNNMDHDDDAAITSLSIALEEPVIELLVKYWVVLDKVVLRYSEFNVSISNVLHDRH